jgi:1,3-beta-glucanosyltransferase GAS1
MKTAGVFSTAIAAASLLVKSAVAQDVPSIVIKGSKFFYENNGTQL